MNTKSYQRKFLKCLTIFSLAFVISLLFPDTPLLSQEIKEGRTEPRQKVQVVYQLTDAVVRDHSGRPVRGLGKDDFTLQVDGKHVSLNFVDEFAVPDPGEVERYLEGLERSREGGDPPPPQPTPSRLVIIAFDQFNMGAKATRAAQKAAKSIVNELLLPYDRIIVLRYNQFYTTLFGPSSEKDQIIEAIGNAGELNRNKFYYPHPLEIIQPNKKSPDEAKKNFLEMLSEKGEQLKHYFLSLNSLAATLNSIPGRKVCLLFSEGPNIYNPLNVPRTTGENVWLHEDNIFDIGDPLFGDVDPLKKPALKVWSETADASAGNIESLKRELEYLFSSSNTSIIAIQRGPQKPEWLQFIESKLKQTVPRSIYQSTQVTAGFRRMQSDRINFLEDLAGFTNGRFISAGCGEAEMLNIIREEICHYYVLGFVPVQGDEEKFHKIDLSTNNSKSKISHRKGFYLKKKFSQLDSLERSNHINECFLTPGILNELGLVAQGYRLPPSDKRQALIAFQLSGEKPAKDYERGYELEMVIKIADRDGQTKYLRHKILRFNNDRELPQQLWQNLTVPLDEEWNALFLALRDNVSGRRSSWNMVFEDRDVQPGMLLAGDLIMLSAKAEGCLEEWTVETPGENMAPGELDTAVHFDNGLQPSAANEIPQGEDVYLLLVIGNLPVGFDPTAIVLKIFVVLDPQSDKGYRLDVREVKARFDNDRKLLLITCRAPVGFAQKEFGELFFGVSGIAGGQSLWVPAPYKISSFSSKRAKELLSQGRITKLASEADEY